MVILQSKKVKLHHRKDLILLEYEDIVSILISSIVSSGEKNYKYFIGWKGDDYKIKTLHIMLPKQSAYIKLEDGESK